MKNIIKIYFWKFLLIIIISILSCNVDEDAARGLSTVKLDELDNIALNKVAFNTSNYDLLSNRSWISCVAFEMISSSFLGSGFTRCAVKAVSVVLNAQMWRS